MKILNKEIVMFLLLECKLEIDWFFWILVKMFFYVVFLVSIMLKILKNSRSNGSCENV